ncbi:MAG TPA: sigma-70 family RNA polymerase sigma factor [Thermodesulfobacteriota bacterium]|nr:sigma-70 family RNA polymerase sigma factor [Thermodesulfobacteriota bacterium]
MSTARVKSYEDGINVNVNKYPTDLSGSSDESLVQLIAEFRSEEALALILGRYRERIYRTALKVTNNHNDAEDVVQEVSLTIYRKAHSFRTDSKFSTWLYRLVTNEAISRLRKIKRERTVSLDDFMPRFEDDGHHAERPVVDWSQEVEKKVAEKEIQTIIEKAMQQLSPIDRTVVVLSEIEELTNPEIGKVLGLSILAVKGRLHRARMFLRAKLAVQLGYQAG